MNLDRSKEIRERLHKEVVVADGAMGTTLYSLGYSYRSCFDVLNETESETIEKLHKDYIAAGAQIIETNTFGANRFRLAEHGFEKRVREINRAGAGIALRAAAGKAYVAGSVGPLNRMLKPIGTLTPEDAFDAFIEQVQGLLDGGVELFIIETMSSLTEIREAIRAVRSLCDLPVVACMTFSEEGKTLEGDKPHGVCRKLIEYGADVVGANCSVGPQPMLDVIERMTGVGNVPLAAQPNAGFPRIVGGRYVYLTTPQYFADYALRFIENGVSLVGGCCGTTADHIAAVANAVRGRSPSRPSVVKAVDVEEKPRTEGPHRGLPYNDFRADLGKRFMISVEIDPPRSFDPEPFIRNARMLRAEGVDLINVADSPLARARMSAMAMAHLIRRDAGVDVLLHMSCRDRNALGLQSELLGAHTLGILNILAVTGDPPSVGDYPFAKAVFELDAVGLSAMISQLNRGHDLTGRKMEEPTQFTFGVAVNPTADDLALEYERLRKKIDAGAEFAFTQPLFDRETLEKFLNDVSSFCRIPVFVGIMPLRSAKHAEFIHNEIPDMIVPDKVREQMARSGTEGARVGCEIAQQFLLGTHKMVQGVYLMPPFNKFSAAVDVIRVLDRSTGEKSSL